MFELVKKIKVVGDKKFKNYYLKANVNGNDVLIPIKPTFEDCKRDYVYLDLLSTKYED